MTETRPTFQELLTSQEVRDKVECFFTEEGKGTHWMNKGGVLCRFLPEFISQTPFAIWQGYLQEAAPPPEPRVFKEAVYFNVYDKIGLIPVAWNSRRQADAMTLTNDDRIGCVRVEITATEGQYND